jgi:hypothetical protein
LISGPFRDGLHEAFLFAIIACLVAGVASWSRGGRPPATSTIEGPRDDEREADISPGLASQPV